MKTKAELNEAITNHMFCHGMKSEHVAVLAEGAKAETFKAGTVIFRQGEPANQFYLIESGKIALEAHDPANGTIFVQVVGGGEVLGWSWLFPPFAWHFQARVLEPTDVLVLSGGHLLVSSERDHDFGYELMKRVSRVVISRLQAARQERLGLQVESVLEG